MESIKIDTDVNSCAFAEYKLGNHHVKDSLVYVTVGTGVGVGVVVHGLTVHGLTHPEGGHIMYAFFNYLELIDTIINTRDLKEYAHSISLVSKVWYATSPSHRD
jgi:predicted NBD/HSP70 family sugar kinase